MISCTTSSGRVVYSQKIWTACVPRTCIFNPPLIGVNFRRGWPARSGVMTPRAILVTCGQSLAASTTWTAVGITQRRQSKKPDADQREQFLLHAVFLPVVFQSELNVPSGTGSRDGSEPSATNRGDRRRVVDVIKRVEQLSAELEVAPF